MIKNHGFKQAPYLLLLGAAIFLAAPVSPDTQSSESMNWITLPEALELASEDGKTVFVFVEAEWCGICKRMKREVFPDPSVAKTAAGHYYAVSIDLDSKQTLTFKGESMTEREFARSMNVNATPTMLFLDSSGDVLASQIGWVDIERFEGLLTFISSEQFGTMDFEQYFSKGKNN